MTAHAHASTAASPHPPDASAPEAAQAEGFQAVILLSEPEVAARAWMQESGGDVDAVFRDRFVAQLLQSFGPYIESVHRQSGSASPRVLQVGGSGRIPGLAEALKDTCGVTATWWERSEFATVLGAAHAGVPEPAARAEENEPPASKPEESRAWRSSPPHPARERRTTLDSRR